MKNYPDGMPASSERRWNFDSAAGLPLGPAGRAALQAALGMGWADPRRLYHEGRVARQLLDVSRASVANVLGVPPDRVSFTASGTAAIGIGLAGLVRRAGPPPEPAAAPRVLASAVEHSAVLRAADWLVGAPQLLPVDQFGMVDPASLWAALAEGIRPAVVAVQAANHELGTVQPLAQLHEAAQAAGVPLFVDAAAALGSAPVPADWDVLAASAHKWGGPAGVGVLAVRPGVRWRAPGPVDEAEAGRVPGFTAIPLIAAAAAALEAAVRDQPQIAATRHRQTAHLRAAIPGLISDCLVLGAPDERLAHILTVSVLYADGEELVRELDRAGFAVSSGSACTSDTRRPSHILAAIGAVTHGNLRISLAPGCPDAAVERFLQVLPAAVRAARARAEAAAR